MKLTQDQLNNLPVYTQNGQFLGRVCGFEFNTETHTIRKYYIAQSSFIKDLLNLNDKLEIASAQVLSISEEKMIVEDNITKELIMTKEKMKQKVAQIPATLSRLAKER